MLKKLYWMAQAMMVVTLLGGWQVGCSQSAERQDKWDERDPYLNRALARKKIDDIDGAIELLNKALDRKPELARAHFEMGWLYDTCKQDYIRAIYHYERYLELRPDAKKKKMVEDLIRQARLSFAASLPDQPPGAVEQIAMLQKEIDALKRQLSSKPESKTQSAKTATVSKPVSTSTPVVAASLMPPKLAPPQPAVQTYVVQTRDTLSSIATKLYNDPGKWKILYDANRNTLSSPQSVRPGQTLIIPR